MTRKKLLNLTGGNLPSICSDLDTVDVLLSSSEISISKATDQRKLHELIRSMEVSISAPWQNERLKIHRREALNSMVNKWRGREHSVSVNAGSAILEGSLCIPQDAVGIVIFVHGSGSSRHSPRNKFVASVLNTAGLGTLLFDLLSPQEERVDVITREYRFNVELLSERVVQATKWFQSYSETSKCNIGYFGASTGAAAALIAAAHLPKEVRAVVSRGGRPDLAGKALQQVKAPTLLIVGECDPIVLDLNHYAMQCMPPDTKTALHIVPNATHLFEEAGTLEQAADLACEWFRHYLGSERV